MTDTDSLWPSPLRSLSTAVDRQHSDGVQGFVTKPAALVQPWVTKDIASLIADIQIQYCTTP